MDMYSKILVELGKKQTHKSLHNNLVKYLYSTEDDVLKSLLMQYIKHFDGIISYSAAKMVLKTQSLIQESIHDRDNLMQYCNQVIMSKKPEWQIIAERNGWRKI